MDSGFALMAAPPIRESDVEALLCLPKEARGNVHWVLKPNKSNFWTCVLDVHMVGAEPTAPRQLKLCLNVNRDIPQLFTYSLILNSVFNIRRICVLGSHRNTHTDDHRFTAQTHIHKWTDLCKDTYAFAAVPDPTLEHLAVFKYFCERCSIAFLGQWNQIPVETRTFSEML